MDWTLVYVESGEEDLLIPLLLEEHSTAPRLARFVSRLYNVTADEIEDETFEVTHHRLFELFESHPSSSYTLMALYYLCINYILGVGCLGVPYAFARAGFLLATVVLVTVTLLSYMTVLWVAESGARLELKLREEAKQRHDQEASENTSLIQTLDSTQEHVHIDGARYEVVDLVSYYLGTIHKTIYQVSLLALMYVGLLAYTQVFCGSMATLLWVDEDSILGIPQLVFAIMVVPLSCYDLDEQVAIQSLMATVRFLALFIMIGGSVVALWLDDGMSERSQRPYFAPADPEGCHMSYTACFSGFGVTFSTALFSQLFQHSVPGLLRPLRDQPRKIIQAPRIFGASLFTTFSFYLLLGTCAASYFGANTQSSVNLNFANFTFGLNPDETSLLVLSMLKIASNVVVMFPALDTISVFPLIANTLGNNLLAASGPAFLKWIAHHISPANNSGAYHDLPPEVRKRSVQRASKFATIFWRLVAAFPPLIGSLWANDLSFSLLLAGVAGLYVAFFAPSLLQLSSSRMFKDETIFSGWYSAPMLAYPVLLFGTFALGVVLLQIHDAWEMGKT